MLRLRIRELAEQQGLTMYALQQKTGISMGAVRRYWYGTSDGREGGEPLKVIYLEQLNTFADALGVASKDLVAEEPKAGNIAPLLRAA